MQIKFVGIINYHRLVVNKYKNQKVKHVFLIKKNINRHKHNEMIFKILMSLYKNVHLKNIF